MKRHIIIKFLHITSIFFMFSNLNLYSHGFSKTTKVHGNVTTYSSFKKLCYNVHEGTTQYVATYDVQTRRVDAVKRVVKSAESEHHVRVYVRLSCQQGYTKKSKDDIVCSIFQQFYCTDTNQWKMAGELKVGDSVLTKSGPKKLTYVDHVKKGHKIKLYMIEVEDTHLFYVGNDAVLTHNFMGLPVAVTLAVDVAFGTGTVAGAAAGSIFGPPVMVIGATIGFFVSMITVAIYQHQLPKFSVDAYTPVSHTVLYESNPQLGYQSQFDAAPAPRVEPVGCFHPVPHEQPIGCGSTEPVKPIIHITLPTPETEKENVGCRALPEEEKNTKGVICILPAESVQLPLICKQTTDDVINKIKEIVGSNITRLPDTKGSTIQYEVEGTFEDALKIFHELGLENVREKPMMGEIGFIGDTEHGTIIVRSKSTYGCPTLEVQDKRNINNIKETKFRFT